MKHQATTHDSEIRRGEAVSEGVDTRTDTYGVPYDALTFVPGTTPFVSHLAMFPSL